MGSALNANTVVTVTHYLATVTTSPGESSCGLWNCTLNGEDVPFEEAQSSCEVSAWTVFQEDINPDGRPWTKGSPPREVSDKCTPGFRRALETAGLLPVESESALTWMHSHIEYTTQCMDPANKRSKARVKACQELTEEVTEQMRKKEDPESRNEDNTSDHHRSTSSPLRPTSPESAARASDVLVTPVDNANKDTQPVSPNVDSERNLQTQNTTPKPTPEPPAATTVKPSEPAGTPEEIVEGEEGSGVAEDMDAAPPESEPSRDPDPDLRSVEVVTPRSSTQAERSHDQPSLKDGNNVATTVESTFPDLDLVDEIINAFQKPQDPGDQGGVRVERSTASTEIPVPSNSTREDPMVEEVTPTNSTETSPSGMWFEWLVKWLSTLPQNRSEEQIEGAEFPYDISVFQDFLGEEMNPDETDSTDLWHLSLLMGVRETLVNLATVKERQDVYGLIFLVATTVTLVSSVILLSKNSRECLQSILHQIHRWKCQRALAADQKLDDKATKMMELLLRGVQCGDGLTRELEEKDTPLAARSRAPTGYVRVEACYRCNLEKCLCWKESPPRRKARVEIRDLAESERLIPENPKQRTLPTSLELDRERGPILKVIADQNARKQFEPAPSPPQRNEAAPIYPAISGMSERGVSVEAPPPLYPGTAAQPWSGATAPPRYREEPIVVGKRREIPAHALNLIKRLDYESETTDKESQ